MAEIFDLGLQQHKIKMDGKFFESNVIAVAGDTARRLEVQLLDSNNMVQNTTGLQLRLNAVVAGNATYTDATLINATEGIYQVDLSNGMLLVPGNWQFQWQVLDSNGNKLNSFAFTGTVGSNLSEGGTEAANFYLNVDELKQMQDDLVNGTFDSAVLETNIEERLITLETEYTPKLNEVSAQLAKTETKLLEVRNSNKMNSIINKSKMEFVSLLNGQSGWFKTNWRPSATEDGDWTFNNGVIEPTFTNLSTGGAAILNKTKRIVDGEIGVTIKGYDMAANSNSGAGIIFKGKSPTDYVVVNVIFNLKQVWVGTLKNGVYQNVRTADISNSQILPSNGETINLSVKTVGNVFSVFFNGTEILKDQVSTYITDQESEGLWGLFIYNASTNVDDFIKDIVFSDLYVKEYDFSTIPNKLEHILYTGDSFTNGAGVAITERWTTLLDDELKTMNPDLVSNNLSVNGSPLSVILEQVRSAVEGEDIVFIMGGTNNARIDEVGTTIEVALSDLRKAIHLAKSVGVIPIIGVPPQMDRTKNTASLNSTSWAWINEFNNKVRQLCAIEKVIIADFYNDFNNDLSLLQDDKLHPNVNGHLQLFETAYRTVTGSIKTL